MVSTAVSDWEMTGAALIPKTIEQRKGEETGVFSIEISKALTGDKGVGQAQALAALAAAAAGQAIGRVRRVTTITLPTVANATDVARKSLSETVSLSIAIPAPEAVAAVVLGNETEVVTEIVSEIGIETLEETLDKIITATHTVRRICRTEIEETMEMKRCKRGDS